MMTIPVPATAPSTKVICAACHRWRVNYRQSGDCQVCYRLANARKVGEPATKVIRLGHRLIRIRIGVEIEL